MKYTCDVCGRKVEKKNIFFGFSGYAKEYYKDESIEKICRKCVMSMDRDNFFERFEEREEEK